MTSEPATSEHGRRGETQHVQLGACFLLRENDLCRLLPQILARITGRSFALDQSKILLGPAKSWESRNHKSRSPESPEFISTPVSAPINNPTVPSAAKHSHSNFVSESLPSEGAFQHGYKPTDCLPCRVPAWERPPERRLGRAKPSSSLPGHASVPERQAGHCAQGRCRTPNAGKEPRQGTQPAAASQPRAPARRRL